MLLQTIAILWNDVTKECRALIGRLTTKWSVTVEVVGKERARRAVKEGRLREEGKAVSALCYFHHRATAGPDSMRPSQRERDIRFIRVRWAFRLLHRLRPSVKSEKNSTSTCCLTTRQLSVRAPISKSRDASWVVVIHREVGGSSSNIVNSSVYPFSSLFPLLSLSYTWTRRERACFYDLLQNLREVKSCITHSVRYGVCVRCDFTVRRATSRPHCNIIFRLLLGVCTREPGLEYTCLPWRGWFGSSNDLKVRFLMATLSLLS